MKSLKIDGMETRNGKAFLNRGISEKVCQELGLAQTGGSDAHTVQEIGNAWTEFEGDVITAIKKRKTKACGGFGTSSLWSRVERRMKGAWPKE